MIKAVIFDQDGLMFDTERISGIAWHQAEKEWGIHLEESFNDHSRNESSGCPHKISGGVW
jgi:beta-phosphoglucomutase-like phosphatase (HAD superfamily)